LRDLIQLLLGETCQCEAAPCPGRQLFRPCLLQRGQLRIGYSGRLRGHSYGTNIFLRGRQVLRAVYSRHHVALTYLHADGVDDEFFHPAGEPGDNPGEPVLRRLHDAVGIYGTNQHTVQNRFHLDACLHDPLRGDLYPGQGAFGQGQGFAFFALGKIHAADRAVSGTVPDYEGVHAAVVFEFLFRAGSFFNGAWFPGLLRRVVPLPAFIVVLDIVPVSDYECCNY